MKLILLVLAVFLTLPTHADTVAAGQVEIRTGMKGAQPTWPRDAFFNLPSVWKMNIAPGSPAFQLEIQKRYGLAFDPAFANDGLPVGMTLTTATILNNGAQKPGVTVSCQACHSASLEGHSVDSISNVFFDYQSLNRDMLIAMGTPMTPFFESNPDKNSMVTYSNYMGRLSIFIRDAFPWLDIYRFFAVFANPDASNALVQPLLNELPLRELVKSQSWVTYKYKIAAGIGLYVDGGYKGSPSATHYALHFTLDPYGNDFLAAVQRFDQVAPDYLKSLNAPAYPWASELNNAQVSRGFTVYSTSCAGCHGTFTQNKGNFTLSSYPAQLVDRAIVQTDPLRIDYPINYEIPDAIKSLYIKTGMYIAPPLVGIWARAPYLHNASVPTLAQVLNSKTRLTLYAIHAPNPSSDNFDHTAVGWTAVDLSSQTPAELANLKLQDPGIRIYNPGDHAGMTNSGHTFGDALSDDQRQDLIAFLKAI
jgi:mono/diheme cytochrome c family protein